MTLDLKSRKIKIILRKVCGAGDEFVLSDRTHEQRSITAVLTLQHHTNKKMNKSEK